MRIIDLQVLDAEGNQLIQTSMMGGATQWTTISDGKFIKGDNPEPSTFFMEEAGNIVWLGETSYNKISKTSAYIQFYIALICIIGVVITFFTLGISLLRKLIFKKPIHKAFLVPFLTILFLAIAISALVLLYDPEKLYSLGAVMYYVSSWLFLIFSVVSFYYFIRILSKKIVLGKWMRFQLAICNISCITIASYLLYWGFIGLTLWNY
jgi:hypothetical protein